MYILTFFFFLIISSFVRCIFKRARIQPVTVNHIADLVGIKQGFEFRLHISTWHQDLAESVSLPTFGIESYSRINLPGLCCGYPHSP